MNDRIHAQLTKLMNNSTTRTYLQDAVVTMRDGRYCLPVKAEAKGNVPGMMHDQSSTGSTLFIEPMAVVNLNNELKELFIKEQEEIEKILGVSCDHAVSKLVEYNLVNEVGRLDAPGRPMLFGTTEEFLRSFGVHSIDELPVLNEDQVEEFKHQAEQEAEMKLEV